VKRSDPSKSRQSTLGISGTVSGDSGSVCAEVRLIERVGRGNSYAFKELYQLYATPLFSYACQSLESREDAEEVLQDTFTRIWEKSHTYDSTRAKPFTWAVMILRGLCMDRLRRNGAKRRAKSVALSVAPEPFTNSSLDRLHFAETASQVTEALAQLPEGDRQCLELAVFGELSQRTIARQLNAPLGTVKTRIRRSLQTIRQLLQTHDA